MRYGRPPNDDDRKQAPTVCTIKNLGYKMFAQQAPMAGGTTENPDVHISTAPAAPVGDDIEDLYEGVVSNSDLVRVNVCAQETNVPESVQRLRKQPRH